MAIYPQSLVQQLRYPTHNKPRQQEATWSRTKITAVTRQFFLNRHLCLGSGSAREMISKVYQVELFFGCWKLPGLGGSTPEAECGGTETMGVC